MNRKKKWNHKWDEYTKCVTWKTVYVEGVRVGFGFVAELGK